MTQASVQLVGFSNRIENSERVPGTLPSVLPLLRLGQLDGFLNVSGSLWEYCDHAEQAGKESDTNENVTIRRDALARRVLVQ